MAARAGLIGLCVVPATLPGFWSLGVNVGSEFIAWLGGLGRKLRGGKTGPVSARHKRLVLSLVEIRDLAAAEPDLEIRAFLRFVLRNAPSSTSQIFQDLFVLHALGGKTNGFFCEFGATDGVSLSNSCMLERGHNWRGILAEPARSWHASLRRNRPDAIIETTCVWTRSGETLSFSETGERELSTISDYRGADGRARKRGSAEQYDVGTVSLNDLLAKHGAPADFDYLSMDTEGSELAILESFDFTRWRPRIITVEHNYTPAREAILELLTAAGYRRVLAEVSLFDDWYVLAGYELPIS